MLRTLALVLMAACGWAQTAPFTIEQVLSAPFYSSLTAAPTGGKVAWVANVKGVRNIVMAEPPAYTPRALTSYTADDGQELSGLVWTPDGGAVIYVRGGSPGPSGYAPNPSLNPKGQEQAVWIVPVNGNGPRKVGDGAAPAISPSGGQLAFVRRGQVWIASETNELATQAFSAHGSNGSVVWSPDGKRIAFVSSRGDHAFVGVYDLTAGTLRYLDPSTDRDSNPVWSPDGRTVAYIRQPSSGMRPIREAQRAGEPWSIRAANVETGQGREVWRAAEGPGSVFQGMVAANQLLWGAGDRLVFPSEADGWLHLYSVPVGGGRATLLTPGEFEIEDAALATGGAAVIYSSNQGDIDRRHVWSVPVAGGPATALTSGTGIEYRLAVLSDAGAVAFLRGDAQRPLHPAVRAGGTIRDIEALPGDFPLRQMVAPQQVVFRSADGLTIHGQLFVPPNRTGRAPAVVFVHGGPRRQMLLGWHPMYYYWNSYGMNQYLASRGFVVLSINFRSGIGYGLNFREALKFGASGGAEFADVQAAGTYLRSRADVDPARIGIWGGSYGGYLTAMALSRASDVFKAGADFHGVHDWAKELGIPPGEPDYKIAYDASPMATVKTWRSPVLLIHGDDDDSVQFNQTVMLKDALRRQKTPYEELILPDEAHDFLMWRSWVKAYQATADFLDRKLAGK